MNNIFFITTLKHIAIKIFNLLIFIAFSAILIYIWWILAGKTYLQSQQPMGGDYFNALTYVNFFYNHLPLPPTGWIPFWNEGSSIIGGYPWLSFYLMKPLMAFFDPASTMEIFASASIVAFFVACFLLFQQISKNWLIAFTLTLIIIVTRATYYPLMTGGFVVSATIQWYLPLVLFFLYKFQEKASPKYLVAASILGGFSLLQHAPTSLLTIIAPSALVLLALPVYQKNLKNKILTVVWFLALASAIGLAGIYTVILQNFLGSGGDACQSPECWGIYPKHLIVWMSFLTPIILIAFSVLAISIKLFKRKTQMLSFLPAFMGFIVFFAYALLANLHLINGAANVMFPTRIFWAANLFLLLITAHLFRSVNKVLPKITMLISIMTTVVVGYAILVYPPNIHKDVINIDPVDSYKFTIDKYKTSELNEIVPEWIPIHEVNWRLDTFNPGIVQWWNYIAKMPSTRGYSAHPLGTHRDWQYLLQYSTRNPIVENEELVKNRALFLLDAFGIGYYEGSIAPYPQSILSDPQIVLKNGHSDMRRDVIWYQFSPDVISPIVSPNNSNTVLFIGDDKGYDSFIRTIAMTNINSFKFIPVKGPQDIGAVSQKELSTFKAVICYRFKGTNWSNITSFAKNGGLVFIETGSLDNPPKSNLGDIFPTNNLSDLEVQGSWSNTDSERSPITENINLNKFSPLIFEGNPWKLSASKISNLKPWAKLILRKGNNVIMAYGELGNGQIIWSGMNLMYHTVRNDNYEEAKMFGNMLSSVAVKNTTEPDFKIQRTNPRIINITGNNFNGIYFKENYDSGWSAKENGQKLKIYKAGLDFMYIVIPQAKQNQNITLSYNGSLTNWLFFLMSLFSLILALLYTMIPHPFHSIKRHAHHHIKQKIGKKLTTWWQREEE
ncbi:MAG: hypothetical protein A3D74_03930 [Candidatus Levybacteria bacterium RIFCSPHIGHO2_02_FULL_37_13]|nr:MAG: hypothetical protein A3D74_03930 [Candidatus Levybacteria bacterium RIFCSPHIGHO2_02_FULL_37_13]OGH29295.1 MAG: hypothetical protein A3E40_00075 [Candidatus Levybacteria bacterium RIFCSPHIGHO2_12_FULL_37_9]OGH39598.1 MAG: hypothetical protein A3B41_01940 [Candidatus Levybacteria bacterium RIFCSPLOWO2_01_FULL_37_26]